MVPLWLAGSRVGSQSRKVLKENLFAGVDLMTDNSRWPPELLPTRIGALGCLDKFDNSFFNIVPRQADCIDPQIRLLVEVAFEALIDAGEH